MPDNSQPIQIQPGSSPVQPVSTPSTAPTAAQQAGQTPQAPTTAPTTPSSTQQPATPFASLLNKGVPVQGQQQKTGDEGLVSANGEEEELPTEGPVAQQPLSLPPSDIYTALKPTTMPKALPAAPPTAGVLTSTATPTLALPSTTAKPVALPATAMPATVQPTTAPATVQPTTATPLTTAQPTTVQPTVRPTVPTAMPVPTGAHTSKETVHSSTGKKSTADDESTATLGVAAITAPTAPDAQAMASFMGGSFQQQPGQQTFTASSSVTSAAVQAASAVAARNARQATIDLVNELVGGLVVMKTPEQTTTTIQITNPASIFSGAQLQVTQYTAGTPSQFNLTFSGLSPDARALIENQANQTQLRADLVAKGYTLQMLTIEPKLQVAMPQAEGAGSTGVGQQGGDQGGLFDSEAGADAQDDTPFT